MSRRGTCLKLCSWEECPVLAISVPIAVEDCRGRCKIFGSGPVREHCRGFRSPVGDPPLDMGMGFLGDELEGFGW
ncbi:unnamed protein product [Camellia sinensis]